MEPAQVSIDPYLWGSTRAGARAGRGFRYQDAAAAWLAALAWQGSVPWHALVPEGVDDITLHSPGLEIRTQLKSRHDPQSAFTQAEVASYLGKSAGNLPPDWETRAGLRLAVVLERPVEGIAATGWHATLSQSEQPLDAFANLLAAALGFDDVQRAILLMARTHLVVEPDPMDQGYAAMDSSMLPPAGVRLVMQQLRESAGFAADSNYAAQAVDAATLDRSDVQGLIDRTRTVIDPDGELRLTAGLAERADFSASLPEAGFYEGVDVMPGHVGAGLVFARPEAIAQVVDALRSKRYGLIVGPSGAGKSALAWLCAHHTRHAVRWYRLRGLRTEDVAKLAMLGEFLQASAERPVGFVVDDVGRVETMGWDLLVSEVEANPGLLAVATAREEDVFVLTTAARTPTVRPHLDEGLAMRIWQALEHSGLVRFSHWTEPLELSQGLLLEYIHLLTAGKRLEQTLREQVRRRLAEGRDDELALLQIISFASAHGAAVESDRLRTISGLNTFPFARALRRLIDEHAVRESAEGALTGLHEIRSSYLVTAIQDLLGEPPGSAMAQTISALRSESFRAFIVRVFRSLPQQESTILSALASRLGTGDADSWAPIFHGLGLATVDRIAEQWVPIARAAAVEDRFSGFVLMMVLANTDPEGLSFIPGLATAKTDFAQVNVADLRQQLHEQIATGLPVPPMDLVQAHELAAALLPLMGSCGVPNLPLDLRGDLSQESLEPLLSFAITLREIGLAHAQDFVRVAGGSQALLERIRQERAWVTKPEIGEAEGMKCVTGFVRFVHDEIHPDLGAAVTSLCEAMAAAVPEAELLISDVLLPNGKPFKMGEFSPHTTTRFRQALPAPARVAWNRALIRAVHRLVSSPNETQRVTALADAVKELGDRLKEAGDLYCRARPASPQLQLFLRLQGLLTSMVAPPGLQENFSGPLDKGAYAGDDVVHTFVSSLQRLMRDLTSTGTIDHRLAAMNAADLASKAGKLLDPALWRMTNSPPLQALADIQDTLQGIRIITGDAAMTDDSSRRHAALGFTTVSRRHNVLPRAVQQARLRADEAVLKQSAQIQRAMLAHGLTVEVHTRQAKKSDGMRWPDVEYAALLPVNQVIDWLTTVDSFGAVAAELDLKVTIYYGAVIAGHVAPMGAVYILSVMPDPFFAKEWEDALPYPSIHDEGLQLYDDTFVAIGSMSAIASAHADGLNAIELEFFKKLSQRCIRNIARITELLEESRGENAPLTVAADSLARIFSRFTEEFGSTRTDTVAADMSEFSPGSASKLYWEHLEIRMTLIERAAIQPNESTGRRTAPGSGVFQGLTTAPENGDTPKTM
ncbi:hypothetical protein SAMN05518845_11661 [Variovorax sp. YR750]|uniref:hypothetical protein n=1 Tax=Variovorax sp. YR750 TaxID=1884384 RepID=UPI0008C60AED|nr:hypothetical protein [Variovorax sp. YR750]SEM09965.1 hypothetical protein SAMN05518845_11661 [Variovorax sp. YR750]